jgi:hypothetical protein
MFDFPKTTGEILASWQQPTWVIPQWALSPKKHDPRKNMRANKACSRRVARLRRKQSKSARATRG